jgi:hypothetical protein
MKISLLEFYKPTIYSIDVFHLSLQAIKHDTCWKNLVFVLGSAIWICDWLENESQG